jgi:hypothetical protein
MIYAGDMTHIVSVFFTHHLRDIFMICARFTPDARHIHEYNANVARTCRAQQGMLFLDPV